MRVSRCHTFLRHIKVNGAEDTIRFNLLRRYLDSALTWQALVLFDDFYYLCLDNICTEKKTQSQEPAGSVGSVTLKATNFLSR